MTPKIQSAFPQSNTPKQTKIKTGSPQANNDLKVEDILSQGGQAVSPQQTEKKLSEVKDLSPQAPIDLNSSNVFATLNE